MKKIIFVLLAVLVLFVVLAVVFKQEPDQQSSVSSREPAPAVQDRKSLGLPSGGKIAAEPVVPDFDVERGPVLSGMVQLILSDETSYSVRAQTIKELGCDLSADDVAALREFLARLPKDAENISPIAFNSLKNDVLEVLMEQEVMPDGLTRQVVDMFNDPDTDYMWKEYCLQFMEPLHERVSGGREPGSEGDSLKDAEMEVVRETLLSALDERDEDLAGTALLGLSRLVRDGRDADGEKVAVKAIEIAADESASDRCRLTAMRVAAADNNADILPVARSLAATAETDLLKAAAITTLGDFADPRDKALLKDLAALRNRQISAAARSALAKYSE